MPDDIYWISPYCVFYFDPDNRVVKLVNGLYGSHFELSLELFCLLVSAMSGAHANELLHDQSEEARTAIRELMDEKVLVNTTEHDKLADANVFCNRLDPLELAFHRAFNEGGYFPMRVDHDHPPPPAKESGEGTAVLLESCTRIDASRDFAECLMERRSIRTFSKSPMKKLQLEQFLQLSARVNTLIETPDLGWISHRNYPSPGARYPLEIYPVIFNIEDVESGLYHYDPVQHRLEPLQSTPEVRELLLSNTLHKMGAGTQGQPAVLFIITAVFARTCWKYRGMPYHAILMETGALYQTMYLVATQLGLAPCGIGAFPELATAEILQLDSLDEAQTGLFVLGLPDSGAPDVLTITRVRLLDRPPYSTHGDNKVLELTFQQGFKEIVSPDWLDISTSASGDLSCRVMGGRYRATCDADAEAEIRRLIQP